MTHPRQQHSRTQTKRLLVKKIAQFVKLKYIAKTLAYNIITPIITAQTKRQQPKDGVHNASLAAFNIPSTDF